AHRNSRLHRTPCRHDEVCAVRPWNGRRQQPAPASRQAAADKRLDKKTKKTPPPGSVFFIVDGYRRDYAITSQMSFVKATGSSIGSPSIKSAWLYSRFVYSF